MNEVCAESMHKFYAGLRSREKKPWFYDELKMIMFYVDVYEYTMLPYEWEIFM